MTTDFRALCTALLDEISHESPTTCLARAALAEPQPEPPTDAELTVDTIMQIADEFFDFYGNSHRDCFFATSIVAKENPTQSLYDFARAVLARWGS
jgi:hypothetical protein